MFSSPLDIAQIDKRFIDLQGKKKDVFLAAWQGN